jgi:hypothetical protein
MVLPIIAGIAAGALGAIGSSRAGKAQAAAATNAANAQLQGTRESNQMLRDFRTEDVARFAPFDRSGRNALAAYDFEMGLGPRPEGYGGFTATPGFDFRMQTGRDAVQGSVAARQGLLSGAALKGLTEFGQNLGSQEYNNYLARLGGMVSQGQAAAGMQAGASQNYAGQIGANTMAGANAMAQGIAGAGNARAAGTVGAFNALGGGLAQGIGAWQQNNMLNAFMPRA